MEKNLARAAQARDTQLRQRYAITLADYHEKVRKQGGVCAICSKPPAGGRTSSRSLHVDHCHSTGVIRGLLCSKCNTALGLFDEDKEVVCNALKYLNKHA